jgi:hypothetical protein
LLPRLATLRVLAPLLQKSKNHLTVVFKISGASKVLRQLALPRLATLRVLAPLLQKSKNHLTVVFKISGASKGERKNTFKGYF